MGVVILMTAVVPLGLHGKSKNVATLGLVTVKIGNPKRTVPVVEIIENTFVATAVSMSLNVLMIKNLSVTQIVLLGYSMTSMVAKCVCVLKENRS